MRGRTLSYNGFWASILCHSPQILLYLLLPTEILIYPTPLNNTIKPYKALDLEPLNPKPSKTPAHPNGASEKHKAFYMEDMVLRTDGLVK